jgi:hypothetical protein
MATKGGEGGLFGRLWERFGEVAERLGVVHRKDVAKALADQKKRKASRQPHRKIGTILVEQGKMQKEHVEKVLKEQKKVAKKMQGKPKKKSAARKKSTKKTTKKAGKKRAKKKPKRARRRS